LIFIPFTSHDWQLNIFGRRTYLTDTNNLYTKEKAVVGGDLLPALAHTENRDARAADYLATRASLSD